MDGFIFTQHPTALWIAEAQRWECLAKERWQSELAEWIKLDKQGVKMRHYRLEVRRRGT